MKKKGFYVEEEIKGEPELFNRISKLDNEWVFRGKLSRYPLQTSLERACHLARIPLRKSPKIEKEMTWDFQRHYSGADEESVRNNRLCCWARMQHYGAPTRLLDWTYSAYVALYFALEEAYNYSLEEVRDNRCGAIWCLNQDWCRTTAKTIHGLQLLIDARHDPDKRFDEEKFKQLYITKPKKFVLLENPFSLHTRLTVQQGVFLCPGSVSLKFETNIKNLKGWESKDNIIKIPFALSPKEMETSLMRLRRMNITRASLFPGLDGLSQSMRYYMRFYYKLSKWREER